MKTEQTSIEWADFTFNPVRGCVEVSPGCANCYAKKMAARNPALLGVWGKVAHGGTRVEASEAMWRSPLRWNEQAAGWRECSRCGFRGKAKFANSLCPRCEADNASLLPSRPRVFCASMSDWLDADWPLAVLSRLLCLIADTPNLDWLLLTKRPENWLDRLTRAAEDIAAEIPAGVRAMCEDSDGGMTDDWLAGHAPSNVWLGVSVEDQARAQERIPALLSIPARVRFLSCEPLLGKVDLQVPRPGPDLDQSGGGSICQPWLIQSGIHWVIAGGESGPGARPMHPDWPRGLRDQCAAAQVPFLFKQWGEWLPSESLDVPCYKGECRSLGGCHAYRVGKKSAGRLLDGIEHNAFP